MEICRVCLESSERMVNIFECIPDKGISVADMISQCTGIRVFRGDSFSKTVCPTCKQDATNAYEIKQLYEKSHRVFCQLKRDFQGSQDLVEEVICEISDSEGTGTEKAHFEVKKEGIGKDSVKIKLSEINEFHCQVKNEPIEEDIFEEDHLYISDCDVDLNVKSEEFKDYEDTMDHSEKVKHHCSHCQKSFPQIEALQIHIRTHTGDRPYKCSYCEKFFSRNQYLQNHIRTHTGERPYKCSHCQKSFSLTSTLTKHIRTHTGERPYKCSHCKKSFPLGSTLQKHIRIHTGERPYKCTHCEKTFSHISNRQTHLRTHTGERPYKCIHCKKTFSQNQVLKDHIRTHTGERPYKCSQCQTTFSHNQSLQKHIKAHTGERLYKCSHCQKTYLKKWNLQRHLKIHTK